MTSNLRFDLLACAILLAFSGACSGGGGVDAAAGADSGAAMDASATDSATSDSGSASDSSVADAGGGADAGACLADGIYGPCSTNAGCNCLRGATVYQFCTSACTTDADCGDPAALGGGAPGCFPINPGATDMICALVCSSEADCPCGLTCTASGVGSVKICAELQ